LPYTCGSSNNNDTILLKDETKNWSCVVMSLKDRNNIVYFFGCDAECVNSKETQKSLTIEVNHQIKYQILILKIIQF
jgi:hypothetical protein